MASEVFGVALVVGAIQFFRTRRMISDGVFSAKSAPYMVVVAGSLVLAASFIVYAVVS